MESRQLLATYVVDTLADENDTDYSAGDFSLREAIARSSPMSIDTIEFLPGLEGTILLGGDELWIMESLNIIGPGAGTITVSGQNSSRVFRIEQDLSSFNPVVSISGLTITGGNAGPGGGGGGIEASFADLTLDGVTVTGNTASHGGGIFAGDLVMINSTISGNQATFSGGGVRVGGQAQFINCTITGNRVTDPVIGIGGGIHTFDNASISTTLYNTIVAGNLRGPGAGTANDLSGKNVEAVSANNLIGNAASAGGLTNGNNGNIVGNNGTGTIIISRVLDTVLSDNGGPTRTHALVTGSRALDAGNNALALDQDGAALTTDQRGGGFARIVDGPDADTTATVDIGAYEAGPRTLLVDSLAGDSDGDYSPGEFTLREAIERTNANAGPDTINFDSGFIGGPLDIIDLGGTQLSIRDSVSINGPGPQWVRVSGSQDSRVFDIGTDANLNPVSVSIADLGIGFGNTSSEAGAGIRALFIETRLILTRVQMNNNQAINGSGGAIAIGAGFLTIVDSSIVNNSANFGGGIFHSGTGPTESPNPTLLVINSTISGNQAKGDAGGVYVANRSAEFRNSTLTENRADLFDATGGRGGGIVSADGFASTTLKNTIVAGNYRGSGTGTPDDLLGTMAATSANNLIGDTATAGGLMHGENGNIVGNDGVGTIGTVVGQLGNYGGPTLTHLLVPSSPAIDAGNNALARNQNGTVIVADQRGFPRIKDHNANGGPKVDIGAVEMQPPVITLGGSITYTENTGARNLASAATFAAVDTLSFEMGTLRVTNVVVPHADDRLAVRHQGTGPGQIGVSGSTITFEDFTIGTFTGGAGATPLVITLNSAANAGVVQALIRSITYESLSEDPPTTARSIRFRVTDAHGAVSNVATKTVNIAAVNDKPVVTLGGTTQYVENATPRVLAAGATVTDVDNDNFAAGRLVVSIFSGFHVDNRLAIRNQGTGAGQIGVSGNVVSYEGTAVGTFTGGVGFTRLEVALNANATIEATQALLRNVTFAIAGDNPTTESRAVRFLLHDGAGRASDPKVKTVNVVPVDDAPVLAGIGGTIGYRLNAPSVQLAAAATLADADAFNVVGSIFTARIVAGQSTANRLELGGTVFTVSDSYVIRNGVIIGTLNANAGRGFTKFEVTFNADATLGIIQQLVRAMRFHTENGTTTEPREVQFSVRDGGGLLSNAPTKTVNVSA